MHKSHITPIPLLLTSIWGFFEVYLLQIIGFLDRIWPLTHTRFMRLLHGKFGGTIIPFEQNLEMQKENRSFFNRIPIKINKLASERQKKTKISSLFPNYLVKGEMTILPTEEVLNFILRSNMNTTLSECFCRSQAQKHGRSCSLHAPLHTCMSLKFPQRVEDITYAPIRTDLKLHEKELYAFFQHCEELGLVHQIVWIPAPHYTYVICNCCPCCCEVLSEWLTLQQIRKIHQKILSLLELRVAHDPKQGDDLRRRIYSHSRELEIPISPIVAQSAFIAHQKEPSLCIGCGKCVTRCYFNARNMIGERVQYNPQQCYGCGLCISTCPVNAIELQRRLCPVILGNSIKGQGIRHKHPHVHH